MQSKRLYQKSNIKPYYRKFVKNRNWKNTKRKYPFRSLNQKKFVWKKKNYFRLRRGNPKYLKKIKTGVKSRPDTETSSNKTYFRRAGYSYFLTQLRTSPTKNQYTKMSLLFDDKIKNSVRIPKWIRGKIGKKKYLTSLKEKYLVSYRKYKTFTHVNSKFSLGNQLKNIFISKKYKKLYKNTRKNSKILKSSKLKLVAGLTPYKFLKPLNGKKAHGWLTVQSQVASKYYSPKSLILSPSSLFRSKSIFYFYGKHKENLPSSVTTSNLEKLQQKLKLYKNSQSPNPRLSRQPGEGRAITGKYLTGKFEINKYQNFLMDYTLTHGLEDVLYFTYFRKKNMKFSYNTKYMLTSYLTYDFDYKKTWTVVFDHMNWYKGVSNSRRPNCCHEDTTFFLDNSNFSSSELIYSPSPRLHTLSFLLPLDTHHHNTKQLLSNKKFLYKFAGNYSNTKLSNPLNYSKYSNLNSMSMFMLRLQSGLKNLDIPTSKNLQNQLRNMKFSGNFATSRFNISRLGLSNGISKNLIFKKSYWYRFLNYKNHSRRRFQVRRFTKPLRRNFRQNTIKKKYSYSVRYKSGRYRYLYRRESRRIWAKRPKYSKLWRTRKLRNLWRRNVHFLDFLSSKYGDRLRRFLSRKKPRSLIKNKRWGLFYSPSKRKTLNYLKNINYTPLTTTKSKKLKMLWTNHYPNWKSYRLRLYRILNTKYLSNKLRSKGNMRTKLRKTYRKKNNRIFRWRNLYLRRKKRKNIRKLTRLTRKMRNKILMRLRKIVWKRRKFSRKFLSKKKQRNLKKFLNRKKSASYKKNYYTRGLQTRLIWFSNLNLERVRLSFLTKSKKFLEKRLVNYQNIWKSTITPSSINLSGDYTILKPYAKYTNTAAIKPLQSSILLQSSSYFMQILLSKPSLVKSLLSSTKATRVYGFIHNYVLKHSTNHKFYTNLVPSISINHYIKNKMYTRLYKDIFQKQISLWYNNLVVRFLEFIFGYAVIFQFFPFLERIVSDKHVIVYKVWMRKMGYYERRLGHKFFLQEGVHLIHISFLEKDAKLLFYWLKTIIQRISFWKTRFIFRFIKYIFLAHFQFYFSNLKAKGFKVKLKGKISVAGNSRKRTILFRAGKTSHTSVGLKVIHHKGTIVTFTGVMGFQIWIFY